MGNVIENGHNKDKRVSVRLILSKHSLLWVAVASVLYVEAAWAQFMRSCRVAFFLGTWISFASVPLAKADWINLTGAETAPTIAEIYVLDDQHFALLPYSSCPLLRDGLRGTSSSSSITRITINRVQHSKCKYSVLSP